jgi:hypothetical protein
VKKLFTGVIIAALSLAGLGTVMAASASAGGARHVANIAPPTQARNLPGDQVIIIRCATMGSLEGDVGRLDSYHKGMPPAGAWVEDRAGHNTDWIPAGQFDATFRQFVCVAVVVTPPAPTTTVPVATTLPAVTTTVPVVGTLPGHPQSCPPGEHPDHGFDLFNSRLKAADDNNGEHPDHGFNGDHPDQGGPGNGDHIVCVPDHPIVTTTTEPAMTTTTEAPTTTTVPVPVTRCFILRHVQICTLPGETTTTEPEQVCPPGEHPDHGFDGNQPDQGLPNNEGDHIVCVPDHPIVTTTTEATTTTVAPTTTTEAPTTTTTAPPEGPCTGLGDCHVVCDNVNGTDDCNICIGNGSCDVIECPVGFELDAQGNCDIVPEQPIAPTTTTVPVATTLPATTTTEAPTTTTVDHHHDH